MKGVPKITKWVLSPHAVSRMEERHISLAEISLLIADPDLTIAQGPKWIFAKALRQEKSLWVVVTVMVRFEGRK